MHNKFYHLELSHYSHNNKFIIFIGDNIKIQYRDRTFYDYHLNREGNVLVADSIINHIQRDLEN